MTADVVEATAVHAPGAELAPYAAPAPAGAIEEYRPRFVMAPEEARALDRQLRDAQRAILRENVDYGTIPGAGDRKNLLKPGAEKLLQWFGFGHRSVEVKIERDDPDYPSGVADKARRIGVTYRTEVIKTIPGHGEVVVATCEGYAGFDEDRYFITEDEARSKAENRERKNAKQYRREPNPAKWEFATEYRAPWNTLVKMAQKRSLVGAAILATGASGLFTQDMEDTAEAETEAAQFRDIAMAALTSLEEPIRKGVGQWYRSRQWPDPRDWTPDQWVAALQAAGFLAGQNAAQQAATQQPAAEQAPAEPAPPAEPDTSGNAQLVFSKIVRNLGDDPWADKLRDISDEDEARRVLAEMEADANMPIRKGHLIRDAIATLWPAAVAGEQERLV